MLKTYKQERAKNVPAKQALAIARTEVMYGDKSKKRGVAPIYGGTEETSLPKGMTLRVTIENDELYKAPWKEFEGHGVIRTQSMIPEDVKDEWVLQNERGWCVWYDWKATLPKAIEEQWDAPPYRTGNANERAMRAMRADARHLKNWCEEKWRYVTLTVDVMENGTVVETDSLCGMESDDMTYITLEARSMAASMLRHRRRAKQAAAKQTKIASRFRDAMMCGV